MQGAVRVRAATTFLGPLPYSSSADSPFDLSGLGRTFFLEDFEDGELNTPGVRQATIEDGPYFIFAARGEVLGPGPLTDSVDSDSGAIDGSGSQGSSLMAARCFQAQAGHGPVYHLCYINLVIETSQSGYLPTAAGFVWTDGPSDGSFDIAVSNGDGVRIESERYSDFGDDRSDGTTSEDRFFGVLSSEGIARLELATVHTGPHHALEIDHLQYGLPVPEPSAAVQLLLAIAAWRCACGRRDKSLRRSA
jgi:hypothetical protein